MRVLVIRLSALGDVILTEPVARVLRSAVPDAVVDLLTDTRLVPLMAAASRFDRVIGYDRHGEDRGLSGMRRVLARIGSEPYDLVIDLQGKLRTAALARRVPAARRRTIRKRSASEAVRSLIGRGPVFSGRHAVDMAIDLLDLEHAPATSPAPVLAIDPSPEPRERRIGLGLGTQHPTKRWPERSFAALTERLAESFPEHRFVLVAGPGDESMLAQVRAGTSALQGASDTVQANPLELAHQLADLDVHVGVDSGPTHIAAAVGVPVVALFGPTSPERWGPRGDQHRVASLHLPCSPCSNYGSETCPLPARNHECMRALSVDEVYALTLEVLRGKREKG